MHASLKDQCFRRTAGYYNEREWACQMRDGKGILYSIIFNVLKPKISDIIDDIFYIFGDSRGCGQPGRFDPYKVYEAWQIL